MISWLGQHVRTLGAAAAKLARSPLATLFNIVVIAIALALPAGLYVALLNLQGAARAVAPEPQLTVFLALEAGRNEAREIEQRLTAHPQVARARFVPRDQALEEMKKASGMAGIAEALERNPLPDAFVLDARDTSAEALGRLQGQIRGWPGIAHVQLDAEWAQRLDGFIRFGRMGILLLGTLLAFALVAITFNTIRLQILTQREEIEVAKLIGATDGFIRRPFLYYGALLGLTGGLAAWGLIWGGIAALNGAVADLGRTYGAVWQLQNLALEDSLSLLGFAALAGWLGAWFPVGRHLSKASPR